MKDVRGQVLLVTDGSTLLGADDKAGVAEIMTAVEKLIASGAPHGELRIVFTTDEEVGRGTEGLDVKELACDWGYTVDGGELGVYEYENFNAAAALVRVHGVGIHPGSAKNIMKNAATIAMELHSLLPADQVPEKTEGYEGFIHLTDMSGDVVEAELHYIIRDHDRTLFEEKKACVRAAVGEINRRYGEGTAEADISDTYYNMREKIEPHRHLLDRAEAAYRACGVAPRTEAIRGGTDGAVLTWMGLPCPNLSTGGYNYHGVHEFIPVDSLAVMPDVLRLEIIGKLGGYGKRLIPGGNHVQNIDPHRQDSGGAPARGAAHQRGALAALGGAAGGCARSGADGAPDRGADANAHTHANAYPGAHGHADPNTDAHARADPDRIYDLYGGRLHACELSAGTLLRKLL